MEHWDHVMTFPEQCNHAMQVMIVHLNQMKKHQEDLEGMLSQANGELDVFKGTEIKHLKKIEVEKEKKEAV